MTKKFGNYAILDPVKYVFEKEPSWYWMINPPTSKGELSRARLLAQERTKTDLDGVRTTLLVTSFEIAMREIAVTFGGTNIPTSENGKTPIIPIGAPIEEIETVLLDLPREMVWEIWNAVGDAVPGYGPLRPPRKPEQKPEAEQDTPQPEEPKN